MVAIDLFFQLHKICPNPILIRLDVLKAFNREVWFSLRRVNQAAKEFEAVSA